MTGTKMSFIPQNNDFVLYLNIYYLFNICDVKCICILLSLFLIYHLLANDGKTNNGIIVTKYKLAVEQPKVN